MKMNNRFIYGILSIVLAAVIAFIAIPAVTSKTSSTCGIARMKNAVPRGTLITADDVELAEVGGFNLPDSVARQTQDVIGTYAATDLFPGDYILPEKVSSVPLCSDLSLNGIPDGMVAISITTQTLATALSDKLQGGDIIRLYHYDDDNELEPVTDIPELRFVKVLSVTDSKGLDVDYTTPPEADEERQQTATITVLATPEQALLLTAAILSVTLARCLRLAAPALEEVRALFERAGIEAAYVSVLLRTTAAALVTRLCADLCRDGGSQSLAAAVETAGALAVLLIALPLLRAVTELLLGYFG